MTRTVHVIISGQVQGVGFRAWTERRATEADLSGWVRNRRDGAVEALFSGPDDSVAAMLQACWSGPRLASVADLAVSERADAPPNGFQVLPTA